MGTEYFSNLSDFFVVIKSEEKSKKPLTVEEKLHEMIEHSIEYKIDDNAPEEVKELFSYIEWVREGRDLIEFRLKKDIEIHDIRLYRKLITQFMKLSKIEEVLLRPFGAYVGVSYHLHLSRSGNFSQEIIKAMIDYKIARVFFERYEGVYLERKLRLYEEKITNTTMPVNVRKANYIEDKMQVFSPSDQLDWILDINENDEAKSLKKIYGDIDEIIVSDEVFYRIFKTLFAFSHANEARFGGGFIYRLLKYSNKKDKIIDLIVQATKRIDSGHLESNFSELYRAFDEYNDYKLFSYFLSKYLEKRPDGFPGNILRNNDQMIQNLDRDIIFKIVMQTYHSEENLNLLKHHVENVYDLYNPEQLKWVSKLVSKKLEMVKSCKSTLEKISNI